MSHMNVSFHIWISHWVMSHKLHSTAKDESCRTWMSHVTLKLVIASCHAGSRTNFRTTFPKLFMWTRFQERDFKFCFAWCPMTLLCVCGVDSFIPELEHLMQKCFHGLFSKKKPLNLVLGKSFMKWSWSQLPSQSKTFPRRLLELPEKRSKIWRLAVLEIRLRNLPSGKWSKIGPATGVAQAALYSKRWVMSHMKVSRHIWTSHWVMSHRLHSMAKDGSCRIWKSHVTFKWVVVSCHAGWIP